MNTRGFTKRCLLMSGVACAALLSMEMPAHAFDYEFNNGIVIRFDNTLQYTVAQRTAPLSSALGGPGNANGNDGDDNLRAGIISNRADLLTKFDISDNGYGFDVTADSFYDTVYNQKTQNMSGATYNSSDQPYTKFPTQTLAQAGRNVELRNLYLYGSDIIGNVPVTVDVGRLVNVFGESLFFAQNGISYGQSPLDGERDASVPNTQTKDLFLPVGQALITAQLNDSVSVSAYYQFEFEPFNFPPVGSYFSVQDLFGEGGQRIYAGRGAPYISPANPGSALYFNRGKDIGGINTGQFGAAVHYTPSALAVDFGFYALQYNDTTPQVYTEPHYVILFGRPTVIPTVSSTPSPPGSPFALQLGNYQAVYADHIQTYGASFSTTEGKFNFAGEASVRANEDLLSTVTLAPGQVASAEHPLYAVGDVAHYQVSTIYLGPGVKHLFDSSGFFGEIAGNNLLAISRNKAAFDADTAAGHMALGFRGTAEVTYFEVVPGLDVSPSIGLGWNFMGKSSDTAAFNGTGIDRGGDLTLGVSATYYNKWTGGITYTNYIAPAGRDPLADRDFVAFNVERTF